jgi:hypothetical protein
MLTLPPLTMSPYTSSYKPNTPLASAHSAAFYLSGHLFGRVLSRRVDGVSVEVVDVADEEMTALALTTGVDSGKDSAL